MTDYRHVTLTYLCGDKVKTIVEEAEHYPALVALQRTYGIKSKLGRRLSDVQLAQYPTVGLESPVSRKGAPPARPLSPDFGRGSGAPV